MTSARPVVCQSPETSSALDALLAHARALRTANRPRDAEATLTDAITIAPEQPDAYRARILLQLQDGRDMDAFATCASMLARGGHRHAATLAFAADILLYLHLRHATLLTRQAEPARADLRSIGVGEPNAVVLAPEFLKRARTLALAAARRTPGSAAVQTTLAECELRAGYASAARRAAERAVACQATAASLLARALATYADYREDSALAQLQAPRLTEFAPILGMGRLLSAPIDQTFCADPLTDDAERRAWVIPYGVHVGAERVERTMTLRVGPSVVRTISKGRVVGGLCFPLDAANRAHVFGVVEDPDLQFATPRCHDLPSLLGRGRNTVLFGGTDRRLLLHSPGIERERGGRAFLLASNCSSSYFHWMMDAIGRLSASPAALTDPEIRFIVPTPLRAFQAETLSWLGITPERMLQVPADEIAGFDELVVVHHRKDGNASHPDVVRWVREQLTIPQLQAPAPPDRRIYLCRGGLRRDRIVNAPEVEDMCRVFGYEVVDIDTMTVAAQRDVFSGAARVVSPVGPGVANILFSPRGLRTVLLSPRGFLSSRHSALASALSHRVQYVLGAERQSPALFPRWDFTVDLRELRAALEATERE